jgi:hypothetical protein
MPNGSLVELLFVGFLSAICARCFDKHSRRELAVVHRMWITCEEVVFVWLKCLRGKRISLPRFRDSLWVVSVFSPSQNRKLSEVIIG